MKGRVRWSHVVIALALVAALAIAAPAIGGPSLKKLVKKEVAKQIAKATGPAGPSGPQGQSGQPGQDATNLFAYVRDNGSADMATVGYGSGVAVSDPAGNSSYQVFFNQSVVNCVVQAVAGTGDPPGGAPVIAGAFPTVDMSAAAANEAFVTFTDTTATVRDTSFLITALC
jgi:hypothetical protein